MNCRVETKIEEVKALPQCITVIEQVPFNKSSTQRPKAFLNNEEYTALYYQALSEMEAFVKKYAQIEELNTVKKRMLEVLALQ